MKNLIEYSKEFDINDIKDVDGNFTINMHKLFKIDPSSFVKLPSLLWETPIKTTRIELELLTGVNMILFHEKGMTEEIKMEGKRKCMYDYDE